MRIWHLRNTDISRSRWDQVISQSINGNLYGWSWYLDAVSPGWEALVSQDYDLIMPLPAKKKYGIEYLAQPILCQQLGIFGRVALTQEIIQTFLREIPKRFRLIEINLNHHNHHEPYKGTKQNHSTFLLDLVFPYKKMKEGYHTNTRRNIDKAAKSGLIFENNIDSTEFIELVKQDQSQGSRILLSQKNQNLFKTLVMTLRYRHGGSISGVRDHSGKLIAGVLMGFSHRTFYYLAPAQSEEGKEVRAMFYLLDRFIETHAGSSRILDFEGSDIEGVARFYEGFGARPQIYYSWRLNRLPFPLKQIANLRV